MTIADFSHGPIPLYEIDTFPTPDGTLGIKLKPQMKKGYTKSKLVNVSDVINQSPNIYWFCRHLEESGWLVKECYIGEPLKKEEKPQPEQTPNNSHYASLTLTPTTWTFCNKSHDSGFVYIVVRKIDESDIEKKTLK